MEFCILLRLVGVMNLILIYLVHLVFKRENRLTPVSISSYNIPFSHLSWCLYVILLKTLTLVGTSDIYRLISFKHGLMIETAKLDLHFDVSLDDPDLHTRSQLYDKSQTSVSIYTESVWMKLRMLPQPVGLLKLMLDVFCVWYSREISLRM